MQRAANATAIALAWLAGMGGGDAPQIAPVTPAEFEKIERELVPRKAETWRTIPWRVDLLAARAEAARSGRPLMIWAMNGHPLGCT